MAEIFGWKKSHFSQRLPRSFRWKSLTGKEVRSLLYIIRMKKQWRRPYNYSFTSKIVSLPFLCLFSIWMEWKLTFFVSFISLSRSWTKSDHSRINKSLSMQTEFRNQLFLDHWSRKRFISFDYFENRNPSRFSNQVEFAICFSQTLAMNWTFNKPSFLDTCRNV